LAPTTAVRRRRMGQSRAWPSISGITLIANTQELRQRNEFSILRIGEPFVPTLGRIHRTAIVDPKARIDSDVFIGPYALIEGAVQISSGTEIQGRAVIVGSVEIGKNNWIGHGTVIGSFPQDLSFIPTANSGVKIGENNVIHEFCTIHRGTKEESNTLVGSNNLLMAGTHLGHNTRLGNNIILENNVLLGGMQTFTIEPASVPGASSINSPGWAPSLSCTGFLRSVRIFPFFNRQW
jgi:UDP-3-O-[3-hydroxymyristoyl] glucosamine N-acyltransferase